MKAKFACADFTFPLLQHEHALDLIANLGFTGVDLGLFEQRSHLWPSKEFKSLQKNARRLKRSLADRGLVAADVFLQMRPDFTPYAINQPSAARRRVARDWFLKTLEYANALGCHHVTTLPGVVFADEGRAASLARSVDELAWRVAASRAAGIVFGTEAHVGSIVPTPETAADLVRRVPGLTLTLDYTHFTRAGVPDRKIKPLVTATYPFERGGEAIAALGARQAIGKLVVTID